MNKKSNFDLNISEFQKFRTQLLMDIFLLIPIRIKICINLTVSKILIKNLNKNFQTVNF